MVSFRGRRLFGVAMLLVAFAVAGGLFGRVSILRALGWALVIEEPPQNADLIVVAVDAYDAGVLEAADLVRAGIAQKVAIFTDPPNPVDREFLRRGVFYNDAGARAAKQLEALGVPSVVQIQRTTAEGSQDMTSLLSRWCDMNDIHSMIIVTTPDHSRRVRRMLLRALGTRNVRVSVRPAQYTDFDPDQWWKTRAGQRTAIIELEKLALDVLLHPLS